MKYAYDSAANRPTTCEPAGAWSAVDAGIITLVPITFGPHSVIAIGMFAPPLQAYDEVPTAAREAWNTVATSVSGTPASVASDVPAYQCTDTKSLPFEPHAPGSTMLFQFVYSVSECATRMAPIFAFASTAFIAVT